MSERPSECALMWRCVDFDLGRSACGARGACVWGEARARPSDKFPCSAYLLSSPPAKRTYHVLSQPDL